METGFVGFIILAVLIVWFALTLWGAHHLKKYRAEKAKQQRARDIEAEMRQDIADRAVQKKVAAKILRESGQKP